MKMEKQIISAEIDPESKIQKSRYNGYYISTLLTDEDGIVHNSHISAKRLRDLKSKIAHYPHNPVHGATIDNGLLSVMFSSNIL